MTEWEQQLLSSGTAVNSAESGVDVTLGDSESREGVNGIQLDLLLQPTATSYGVPLGMSMVFLYVDQ